MCSTFYAVGCVFLRNAKMINCLEIPHRSCKVLSDNGLLNISAEGCHYVRVCLFSCGSGDYWRAGSRVLCKNSTIKLAILCIPYSIWDYIAQNSIYSAFFGNLTEWAF